MATAMVPPVSGTGENPEAQKTLAHTPDNPQTETIEQQQEQLGTPDDIKTKITLTLTTYRTDWAPDRLLRIPNWMRNVMMYRGQQQLSWDPGSNCYFDALAWFRKNGKVEDGSADYLEKYMNNITQMLGTAFKGIMSRGVPAVTVRPENAEILADVTTARAAGEAISIIERMNDIPSMVLEESELLYLYGSYFKYTRGVLDGDWAGWDEVPVFGEVAIQKPARMHCYNCGTETPLNAFGMSTGRSCPRCQAPLGPESFQPANMDIDQGVVGMDKLPRAMVRQTVHGPLEIDVSPTAKYLRDTPTLSFDQEVDIGSLRMVFPAMFEQLKEGAVVATTPNASYEQLRRNEVYSQTYGYTSDVQHQMPTYSQNWLQPTAYGRLGDQEFSDYMHQNFPEGCKVSYVGDQMVEIRKGILTKEWTACKLHDTVGLYCPSIADNVVPFNERFNDVMDVIDDWIQRCALGMVFYDQTRIDKREIAGKVMGPGVLNGVSTKSGGVEKALADLIMQFKFDIDPAVFTYPGMLMNFCFLISGMPPQTFGGGTQEEVETAKGQAAQLDMANTKLDIYWKGLKKEHAAAAQNAIECLQKLMKAGVLKEIQEVIEDNGEQYRNNYVDFEKLNGRVKVYDDVDQGLPLSSEQIRTTLTTLVQEAGQGNQIATEMMSIVPNQEIAMSVLLPPGMVHPNAAQRARTQQHINTLMEQPWVQTMNPQTGQPMQDLPVKPEKNVDDFPILKDTVRLFRQENGDYALKNPDGWARLDAYYELAEDMEMQKASQDAQRQSQVKQAGAPPQKGPSPMEQAAASLLIRDGADAVQTLQEISHMPPQGQNGNLAPQVSAAGKILDNGLKLQKLIKE